MTKETTCFSGNCHACMNLCTVSQFLVCVNMCGNRNILKACKVVLRIVEREGHYLTFWYMGMYKASNNRRVKAWCFYSWLGV